MNRNVVYMALLGVLVGCYEMRNNSESNAGSKKDGVVSEVEDMTKRGGNEEEDVTNKGGSVEECVSNDVRMAEQEWGSVRREYNNALYRNDNAEFPSVDVYGWELHVNPREDGKSADVRMNHQATMAVYVSGEAKVVDVIEGRGVKLQVEDKDGKGVEITLTGDKAVVVKNGEEIWMHGTADGKERKYAFGMDAGICEIVTAICGNTNEGKSVLEDAVSVLEGKKTGLGKVVDKENGYLKVEFGEGRLFWGVEAKAWDCESGARIVMMQWKDLFGEVRMRLYRADVKEGVVYEIENTMNETDMGIRKEYGLDSCDWEYVVPKKDTEVVIQWHISKSGERGKNYWYYDKGRNRFDTAG